jgi:hypothetical protein
MFHTNIVGRVKRRTGLLRARFVPATAMVLMVLVIAASYVTDGGSPDRSPSMTIMEVMS